MVDCNRSNAHRNTSIAIRRLGCYFISLHWRSRASRYCYAMEAWKMMFLQAWKKTKDFVVRNWKAFIAALYAIFVWFYFKAKADRAKDVIKIKEDSHKKQLDAIEKAHDKEIALRDEALAEYEAIIAAIRADYKEKKKRLSKKKKEEVARLVEENKDNPSALAEQLSEKFGITYTRGEEQ